MNTLRSDLLDDGERVLVLGDYSSHVPGSSGHVVAFWLEDVAGHVHQVDTWTETQHWVNKNFPTKTLNRVKSQTPTGCEELPCSRNHHHSAVWVSCDRIKAIHHLTADRRRQNRCEDDVPGTSDRPVTVSVTRFVPPEGFVHGVAFLRTVQLHMCDELCRLTDGQRSVRRSRTAWRRHGSDGDLSRQPQPSIWEKLIKWKIQVSPVGRRQTRTNHNTLLTKTWQIKWNVFTLDRTRLFFIRLHRQKTSQENLILLHVQKLIPGREKKKSDVWKFEM